MSTLVNSYLPLSPASAPAESASDHHLHLTPALLEYRGEEDPDADFIPKTVAGFALGAMTMGICLEFAENYYRTSSFAFPAITNDLLIRFAFMLGITGVSTSLFLVALKVRADRSSVPLYARHWLNSIGTGGSYALLVWAAWMMQGESIVHIDPFVAVALLMILSSAPLVAARWTIGPHYQPSF